MLSLITYSWTHIKNRYLGHTRCNGPQVNTKWPHWWSVIIGSGNGQVWENNRWSTYICRHIPHMKLWYRVLFFLKVWRGALMFSLICVWINGWVNNREAVDLRRYRGHYDVIVMQDFKNPATFPREKWINSLALERFKQNFRQIIFKLISVTDGWGISCKIVLRWMPLDLTDDTSTLVKIMSWCRQATSHYLSLCWPRFMSPYGVTRPQWVNWYHDWNTLLTSWNTDI